MILQFDNGRKNSIFNLRISSETKTKLADIYGSYGLRLSDAVNLFFAITLAEGRIPLDLESYNIELKEIKKEN